SHIVTSDGARSLSFSTRLDVLIFAPRFARCLQSAFVMDCAPPRGIGHPTACAAAPSKTPNPALKGSSRLKNECAAKPAKSALVRSSRNRKPLKEFAEGRALRPKRANSHG